MAMLRLFMFACVFSTAAFAATGTVDPVCTPAGGSSKSPNGTVMAASCIEGDCCGKQGCWTSCDCW